MNPADRDVLAEFLAPVPARLGLACWVAQWVAEAAAPELVRREIRRRLDAAAAPVLARGAALRALIRRGRLPPASKTEFLTLLSALSRLTVAYRVLGPPPILVTQEIADLVEAGQYASEAWARF